MARRMNGGHRPGRTRALPQSTAAPMGQEPQRSRKGCPECRKRKVKCDEQKPGCGQCLRAGRVCRIVDSLFRPHTYSFLASSSSQRTHRPSSRQARSPHCAREAEASNQDAPADAAQISQQTQFVTKAPSNGPEEKSGSPGSRARRVVSDPEHAVTGAEEAQNDQWRYEDYNALAGLPDSGTLETAAEPSPRALVYTPIQNERNAAEIRPPTDVFCSLLNSTHKDNYQDGCEVAFFLRHFSEGPGRWMDVCCDQPYFSEQVALLSPVYTLVRYAAVALAAKQLGYMKNPESGIRQTQSHRFMLNAFADSKLDFLWYGAKYYDKAIRILAQQLSHEDGSLCQLSPWGIYQTGLTPQTNEYGLGGAHDSTAATLQALVACILCQYEDLSATMRAWSGHLNGIHKLLRPYLSDPMTLPTPVHIPHPNKAMDAVYWFFALNEMLDAYVNKRRTRLDFKETTIWRRMGLPLDDSGYLMPDYIHGVDAESILFKALIRLMYQLVNSDLGNLVEWNAVNAQFDRWQAILPLTFSPAISWPPSAEDDAQGAAPPQLFSHEAWFPRDVCALSMAFYNMARILLLVHRPLEVFLRNSQHNADLLSSYHSLQQSLRGHAIEIISIARGAPNSSVRKYLLQPLYVAGRCLADTGDREELLDILRQIDNDLGVFTDYRQKDLCEEWGIPYEPVTKNIVL